MARKGKGMSRPREWAQLADTKRDPHIFDQLLGGLDDQGESEDELVDPYFGDAYHTMPGFGDKESEK